MLNDSHCHFFSTQFFNTLSRQRGRGDTVAALCQELQWDDPARPTHSPIDGCESSTRTA